MGTTLEESRIASCPSRTRQGSNSLTARNGDEIYLAGCAHQHGETTVELIWQDAEQPPQYHFLNTYSVTVVDEEDYYDSTPTPTSTPIPTPTAISTPTATATPSCIPTPPHTTKKHQADHTVKYHISGVPSIARTPPTPFGTPGTPTPVPANFRSAIDTAVAAWNLLAATLEPHVLFCTSGNPLCSSVSDRNLDGYTIPIKVIPGDEDETYQMPLELGFYGHCRPSAVCVKSTNPQEYGDDDETIRDPLHSNAPAHLENITMIIEDPAFEEPRQLENPATRVYWANDATMVGNMNPENGQVWRYLPSTVMHEYGHTAGLVHPADIHGYAGLMGFPGDDLTPSFNDVNSMRTLYSGRCRHAPTPTN